MCITNPWKKDKTCFWFHLHFPIRVSSLTRTFRQRINQEMAWSCTYQVSQVPMKVKSFLISRIKQKIAQPQGIRASRFSIPPNQGFGRLRSPDGNFHRKMSQGFKKWINMLNIILRNHLQGQSIVRRCKAKKSGIRVSPHRAARDQKVKKSNFIPKWSSWLELSQNRI